MKVIIAGSRSIRLYRYVEEAIAESGFAVTAVISGTALGVDHNGEVYAINNQIPCVRFYPDWGKYGKGAGMRRNQDMVNVAEALIAVWDGESRGTADVIVKAQIKGIPIYVKEVKIHHIELKGEQWKATI